MKRIPIRHKGRVVYALVDNEDYKRLSQIKWYCIKGYAIYQFRDNFRKMVVIPMHSFITNTHGVGVNGNYEVDHINGNRLDNQKHNLRKATRSQNLANRAMSNNNTSGYKGVSAVGNHWHAQIGYDNKLLPLGTYSTAEEAAQAYDAKAKELFGEFAKTNF